MLPVRSPPVVPLEDLKACERLENKHQCPTTRSSMRRCSGRNFVWQLALYKKLVQQLQRDYINVIDTEYQYHLYIYDFTPGWIPDMHHWVSNSQFGRLILIFHENLLACGVMVVKIGMVINNCRYLFCLYISKISEPMQIQIPLASFLHTSSSCCIPFPF